MLLACLSPLLLYAALNITFGTSAVAQWLPSSGEERQRYDLFLDRFGDDLILLLSWPGCDLQDARQTMVADALKRRAESDPHSGIQRVMSTAEAMDDLTSGRLKLSTASAARRMKGVLIGADGTCAVLAQMSQDSATNSARALQYALDAAEEAGLSRQDLRIGGSAFEAVFIDEASERSLKLFVIPSCLAALIVAWLTIGDLRLTLVILLIAAYGQLFGISVLYFAGRQLNAVLIVLPTLYFMLTVSAAVHLVNYYRDAGGDEDPEAGVEALRLGWWPCVIAATTTLIGLSSLATSRLQPVREFGIFASVGLFGATLVLLATFPFLVSVQWRMTRRLPSFRTRLRWTGTAAVDWMTRYCGAILLVCFLGLGLAVTGLVGLKTTIRLEDMFKPDSEILRNYTWLEQHVGPLVSVETVCSFSSDCELNDLERMAVIEQVHVASARVAEVGGVYSALTFLPRIPQGRSMRTVARRAVFRKGLRENRDFLVTKGLLSLEQHVEHWRISAKVPAIGSRSYAQQRQRIADACQEVSKLAGKTAGFEIMFTGLSPVFHEAQQQMLQDLGRSFLLAFLLILPVMVLVLRTLPGGIIAMLPNVAPVVLVCGTMGSTGIPYDVASILTVSVALGIAVDDTMHFLTWFGRAKRNGDSQHEAVKRAYAKCSVAMVQTTMICCAAMLVFLPTDFLPTRKFAILMSLMLCAAIIGDLILLPTILVSRLGRWLVPSRGTADNSSGDSKVR